MTTDTLIHQYIDDAGDTISIWHNQKIADSIAFRDFKTVYAEAISDKFSSTTFLNAVMNRIDRIEVIYTTRNEEILTGGAFEHNAVFNEAYLTLGFVPVQHRGNPFLKYRLLQEKSLHDILKSRGVTQLAGWININNTNSLRMFERRGYVQESVKVIRQL
jgi:hypothetical protein